MPSCTARRCARRSAPRTRWSRSRSAPAPTPARLRAASPHPNPHDADHVRPASQEDRSHIVAQQNSSTTVALSAEQTTEVLRLIKGSDSVELKLSVPDADQSSSVAALELDVLQAQIRQVVFFDTPGLALNARGLVLRARRVQGREGDSVVKLRPVDPSAV